VAADTVVAVAKVASAEATRANRRAGSAVDSAVSAEIVEHCCTAVR